MNEQKTNKWFSIRKHEGQRERERETRKREKITKARIREVSRDGEKISGQKKEEKRERRARVRRRNVAARKTRRLLAVSRAPAVNSSPGYSPRSRCTVLKVRTPTTYVSRRVSPLPPPSPRFRVSLVIRLSSRRIFRSRLYVAAYSRIPTHVSPKLFVVESRLLRSIYIDDVRL